MPELKFKLEKETKNTIRYQEVVEDKPPIVGTIYVQKWWLSPEPPKELTVTIERSSRNEGS